MINFSKKSKKTGIVTNCDVLITYSVVTNSSNNRLKTLRFSFSEKAVRMICGNNFYGQIGFDKEYPNRLYFCSAKEIDGYKLTKTKSAKRYQCYFGNNVIYKDPTSFIGEYNLEYDAVQGALYIDKNKKKEKNNNETN